MATVQLDPTSNQLVCGGMTPRACEVVAGKRERVPKRRHDDLEHAPRSDCSLSRDTARRKGFERFAKR